MSFSDAGASFPMLVTWWLADQAMLVGEENWSNLNIYKDTQVLDTTWITKWCFCATSAAHTLDDYCFLYWNVCNFGGCFTVVSLLTRFQCIKVTKFVRSSSLPALSPTWLWRQLLHHVSSLTPWQLSELHCHRQSSSKTWLKSTPSPAVNESLQTCTSMGLQ